MANMTQEECVANLAAARTALNKLMITGQATEITYGDRTVKYTRASIGDLQMYIQQLAAQCGGCDNCGGRGAPLEVIF